MENKKLNNLRNYLLKEQFNPSLLGIFLNPFYFGRRAIYKNIRGYSNNIRGTTLDIGCGSKPYSGLFSTDKYIGMDIEISGHSHSESKVDVYYDGVTFPFENDSFDSIVCFEVLEHIFNPDDFLMEAKRVLRSGGLAVFTVPFIWDEHEQPFDYARYSSFGLKYIFEKSGFTICEHKKYLCDLRILALLSNAYIYKLFKRLIPNKLSLGIILPLTSLINLIGHVFYLLPNNNDLYFGNIFLLRK